MSQIKHYKDIVLLDKRWQVCVHDTWSDVLTNTLISKFYNIVFVYSVFVSENTLVSRRFLWIFTLLAIEFTD